MFKNIRPMAKRFSASFLSASLAFSWLPAVAAPLNLANSPLFLPQQLAPNLVVTLDDSGSMTWAYVPDALASEYGNPAPKRLFSADYNPMYYNPATQYVAPVKSNAGVFTKYTTTFTNAWINGFDPTRGSVDLSTAYRPTREYNPANTSQTFASQPNDLASIQDFLTSANRATNKGGRAFYYTLNKADAACVAAAKPGDTCFVLHRLSDKTADEQQNFANWYSFYRTRNLTVASAASLAFSEVDPSIRVAFQALNTCKSFGASSCTGWSGTTVDNRIRRFENNRDNFYKWIERLPASGGTPLRSALKRAGVYYENGNGSAIDDPYAFDPNVTAAPYYSCRASFSLTMTDGIWNTDSPGTPNYDGTSYSLPDGKTYAITSPYKDSTADTLSDIAFYYWSRDLRPTIDDRVPLRRADKNASLQNVEMKSSWTTAEYWDPANDPANWQHMASYTIGLGLTKGLATTDPALVWNGNMYGGSYASIAAGTTAWPAAASDSKNNPADLWHAAINGRGKFYSAESSADIVAAFKDMLENLNVTLGAAGSAATSSTTLTTGTAYYKSVFHPNDNPKPKPADASNPWNDLASADQQSWWGDLQKLTLSQSGSALGISNSPIWSAAVNLKHDASNLSKYLDSRVILSSDPDKAAASRPIAFRWSSLSATQQAAITGAPSIRTGQERLNWLRGDATREGKNTAIDTSKGLRNRPVTKLGDIVNSTPVYVGKPDDGLADPVYAAFRADKSARMPMVYVGANDGMLHGFRESDGVEVMAYVPSQVYPALRSLTEETYPHKSFVDGHLTVRDAKFTTGYRSVLVSGLRAGGKGYFALDVTDPLAFGEANPGATVLWEFTTRDDAANLGYSYGRPVIAKLNNGKWAAIFSNGYNSTNGKASLYVAYIEEGKSGWVIDSNFRRIDTGVGDATTPNGLSSPGAADIDGDGDVDYVYAGDLRGNLWKFDLTGAMGAWSVGATPLFKATDANSVAQPITTAPEITLHPAGGYFVLFGTGQAIQVDDLSNKGVQSFYGVWDTTYGPIADRSKLLQHVLTENTTRTDVGKTLRSIDEATPSWWDAVTNPNGQLGWYVDLKENGAALGERVIEDPLLRDGVILFVSAVPVSDPCSGGGYSWLNEIDAITGARLKQPPFDLNGDGQFNLSGDADGAGRSPASNKLAKVGGLPALIKTPSGPGGGQGIVYKLIKQADGSDVTVADPATTSSGRLNWRDIAR